MADCCGRDGRSPRDGAGGHRRCNPPRSTVTFYVEKSLAHGRVRFGVSPRHALDEIDADPALSTGNTGEFLRRRTRGFFFADTREIGAPTITPPSVLTRTTFWESFTTLHYGLMGVGALFVLLGLANLAKHNSLGILPLIVGLALGIAPIVLTAARRRQIRSAEEKVRAEREERERRERERLDAYASALQKVRENASDENLSAALQQRQNLEVPYKIWLPLAKRTVLWIGFDALARLGPSQSKEVAKVIAHAGDKIGLERADVTDVKADLYRILLWHLVADDRLGDRQSAELSSIRSGFGISDTDLAEDQKSIEQFNALRGIDRSNLPKSQCEMKLDFHEYCIHKTNAKVLGDKGEDRGSGPLFLTNKRVFVAARRPVEIPLTQIDDVEVDVDKNRLVVDIARPAKPVAMEVEQPVYTAALIDIAATLDERPRGFA